MLSQFTPDHPGQKTLADFGLPPQIYVAGRLDADSEGLLLLTDDGSLIHKLLNPSFAHERTYLVQLEKVPASDFFAQLRQGIRIGSYQARPAYGRLLEAAPPLPDRVPPIRYRRTVPTSWIELTLTEGKNHQVRRMTAALGHPTLRLVRIAIGPLRLTELPPGSGRWTTTTESDLLQRYVVLPGRKVFH